MTRKCIFTGKKATRKKLLIPKKIAIDEIHNWTNDTPCSEEFLLFSEGKIPSELEMEANETFRLLELHKLRVRFYEIKLEEIQEKINKIVPKTIKNIETRQKDNQIQKSIEEKFILDQQDIIEEMIKVRLDNNKNNISIKNIKD